ncbi:hypothetical protein KI688_012800 [Linnemannia hyalina]|uniref:F-box domain-containing protein n=1 Tax=Linnemannia hyalina TaxID=64524 RepID=A0A9P7XUK5_9FUNG|nr:hypothetical protein KI688_012800 [Linnemannia hyalina]
MSTLSNNTPQISIFDIPHILDLICEDLTKDQLLTCLDVSRTWRTNFTLQALRYVRFSNLNSRQTWTVLHSAGLIRSLTIDIADAGWFLDNAFGSSYYTNLQELHCVDFNYLQKPRRTRHYHMRPSIVDQSQNALQLIESCPNLHSLAVDHLSRQYRTDHFTEDIFKSIYTHTSLTTIKIHLENVPLEFSTVLIKSLPANLKDFELSVLCWLPRARQFGRFPAPRQFYPEDGYPWQQQEQGSMESSTFSGARTLPLERLALGGLHERRRPGWAVLLAKHTEPAVVIDNVVLNPGRNTSYYSNVGSYIGNEIVESIVGRSTGLRHLVLKEYSGSWIDLLQFLLDNCPELETFDVSEDSYHFYNNSTSNGTQLRGSFAALKEFRMSAAISNQVYISVAKMVLRSAATLEVVRIDRNTWDSTGEGAHPFHIGTAMSWTQCTRLKELGIYRDRGSQHMTDHPWNVSPSFSIWEPIKDYSTVFGQLEKLQLSVKESLWRECPDRNYHWDEYDYHHHHHHHHHHDFYSMDLDEKDDEDWKPLKAVAQTKEERTQERQRQQVERNHQRPFILLAREVFGRLKDLQQLRELEIHWDVCSSISEMSLEHALELFRETEVNGSNSNGGYERTSKGWWKEVTHEDLIWLCLPWLSQPHLQSSTVPSHLIKAAARQYENKTRLPAGPHDIPDCINERSPWSTGDIYNARVGRQWKDWDDINQACHPYAEAFSLIDELNALVLMGVWG